MKSLNSSPNQHGDFVREGFVGECPPMTNTKTWKMHSSKKKNRKEPKASRAQGLSKNLQWLRNSKKKEK